MTQTSTKRRSIIIASIVTAVLVVASIGAVIVYNQLTATRISLDITTTQTEVVQGSSSQVKVYVISIGKPENVTLSSNVGLSSINCTFEPAFGESNFTSTLTYAVSDSTPTGKYPVTVTASSGGHEAKISSVLSVLSANVTVSGRANSNAICQPFFSSLIGIQFTDTQTGANTSFDFHFPPPPTLSPFGNYSVTLMNKHTYAVTVSYYYAPSLDAFWQIEADYIGNFTVYAPAGETAISESFG
jgi:hypothetical protein